MSNETKDNDAVRATLSGIANETENEGIKIVKAIRLVLDAIVETVDEVNGGPSSAVYLALVHHFPSLTVDAYQKMINLLVSQGRLINTNHWLEVPLTKKP